MDIDFEMRERIRLDNNKVYVVYETKIKRLREFFIEWSSIEKRFLSEEEIRSKTLIEIERIVRKESSGTLPKTQYSSRSISGCLPSTLSEKWYLENERRRKELNKEWFEKRKKDLETLASLQLRS